VCNAWSVGDLRAAILLRLTHPIFLQWDLVTKDDASYAVVNVSWDSIEMIKRIQIGTDEIIDSSLWYSGHRSFVSIVCPHRDRMVVESPENFNYRKERCGNFPIDESFLHPAHIRCFVRVKYDVISKAFLRRHSIQIDISNPLPKSGVYLNRAREAEYHVEETTYAVCDFFKGHRDRVKWAFAGTKLMFSPIYHFKCFKI
jgi:hypothetical protein